MGLFSLGAFSIAHFPESIKVKEKLGLILACIKGSFIYLSTSILSLEISVGFISFPIVIDGASFCNNFPITNLIFGGSKANFKKGLVAIIPCKGVVFLRA